MILKFYGNAVLSAKNQKFVSLKNEKNLIFWQKIQ